MSTNDPTLKAPGGWRFENTYVRLPAGLFDRTAPVPVRNPSMAVFNHALAAEMGLDVASLDSPYGVEIFSGNVLPAGAEPIAQAYAGHQFGHFTILGDGRAILLGEHLDPLGRRWDVQLKGAGRTRYSRRGDGRAALGPMLREYIISEAMHQLGIPTTRSLAVVATGEMVHREDMLPGAVLTRIASSHIRVGTFEYASTSGDAALSSALLRHTLERHYPECATAASPARALLEAACRRQATLVARWFAVGFVHGVMNTDNMALSGETIDYGPCAFLDTYDPATVFSSIDHGGRYAFAQQPPIAHWNLARLAEALLPLIDSREDIAVEEAMEALSIYPAAFKGAWLQAMGAKIGLFAPVAADIPLIEELLVWMLDTKADFTNTFRALDPLRKVCGPPGWGERWLHRLGSQPHSPEEARRLMKQSNPAVIPRNHKVEEALDAAVSDGDFSAMHRLLDALTDPYADRPRDVAFINPAPPTELPYHTFCGT